MSQSFAAPSGSGKFHFSIDRGGTFTDIHCVLPCGRSVVRKLLSCDPSNYADAPTEGIRRILNEFGHTSFQRGEPISCDNIHSIRMGTTVATNSLLERTGARTLLLITKGFGGYRTKGTLTHLGNPNALRES